MESPRARTVGVSPASKEKPVRYKATMQMCQNLIISILLMGTPGGDRRAYRGAAVSNYLTRFVETLLGFCDTKIGKVGVACGADPKSDGPFNLTEL